MECSKTMSHWRTEIECHTAFQEGGAELMWAAKGITDQDVQWIASALANPAVRSTCPPRIRVRGMGSDTALTVVRGMTLNLLLHGSSSVNHGPRRLFSARAL